MSVCAFILNPQNDFERNYFIPIATESFFKECWMPAIESLCLRWTVLFSTGIDVEEGDVPNIMNELLLIKEWAHKNLGEEQRIKILERIEGLQEELPKAFQRREAIVFIG